jgi:Flp pilus assembly protein TadD/uncharacterized protein (AIM24 family)
VTDQFQLHLARGGELLKVDKVDEARAELEAARALRPSDAKVRSLLGLVYFRAGDFTAARAVFSDLATEQPDDAALRMNLGLVHLKLGETEDAISMLAAASTDKSARQRALGYLGLAYARAGRYAEARDAFAKAGQGELAREMEAHLAGPEVDLALGTHSGPIKVQAREPVAPAATPTPAPQVAMPSMRARAPRLSAPIILGTPRLPVAQDLPRPLLELVSERLVATSDGEPAMRLGPGGLLILRTRPRCVARAGLTIAAAGALTTEPAYRREKGRQTDVVFGAEDQRMHVVSGPGALVLAPPPGKVVVIIALDDEALYVREEALLAFHDLRWENGRVPQSGDTVPLVQLRGKGVLALVAGALPVSLKLTADLPLTVPSARLLGWVGRVVPRLRDEGVGGARVECHGEGAVLVDAAPAPAAG